MSQSEAVLADPDDGAVRPISEIVAAVLKRPSGRSLPSPMPPAVASAVRSVVSAAECAALAGIPGEHFDTVLEAGREAFRLKHAELTGARA